MSVQLAFTWQRPVGLGPCAFGDTGDTWDGPHHCAACAAAVEEAVRFCAAEIAAGRYDAGLYTPAERRAQLRGAA